MLVRIGLDQVKANPFQVRVAAEGIDELAASIVGLRTARPETGGLLQVPPARLMDSGEVADPSLYESVDEIRLLIEAGLLVVELAAGHRRLAAFRELVVADPVGNASYFYFPVELEILDDEQMATVAWTENAARLDLTPIEQAFALKRALGRFGWSQAEIGRRWHMSRSAVANKLRLLKLPDDVQESIQARVLSERHGRLLLAAGKRSPGIYAALAVELLPMGEVEAGVAEKAKEIHAGVPWWPVKGARVSEVDRVCGACGLLVNRSLIWYRNGLEFLCARCYRAVVGWSAPSVADSEERLDRITQNLTSDLSSGRFPHDEPVGLDWQDIHHRCCVDCEYRDDGKSCWDRTCYRAKEHAWRVMLEDRIKGHWLEKYGWVPEVDWEYGGKWLRSSVVEDRALAADKCTKCERLILRGCYARSYLGACDGLPFVMVCNAHAAYRACVRKVVASESAGGAPGEAGAVDAEALARQERSVAFLERARRAVALALAEGNLVTWRGLAAELGGVAEAEQSLEAYTYNVACGLFHGQYRAIWFDWAQEAALDEFREVVVSEVSALGVELDDTI